jgi:hypothetical protein
MVYEICIRCGKMFPKNGRLYCEDCFEKAEKERDLIIEYIKKDPDATILEIIRETGVSLKSIDCLVEEGHVSYVENKLKRNEDKELSKSIDKIPAKKGEFYIKRN